MDICLLCCNDNQFNSKVLIKNDYNKINLKKLICFKKMFVVVCIEHWSRAAGVGCVYGVGRNIATCSMAVFSRWKQTFVYSSQTGCRMNSLLDIYTKLLLIFKCYHCHHLHFQLVYRQHHDQRQYLWFFCANFLKKYF